MTERKFIMNEHNIFEENMIFNPFIFCSSFN